MREEEKKTDSKSDRNESISEISLSSVQPYVFLLLLTPSDARITLLFSSSFSPHIDAFCAARLCVERDENSHSLFVSHRLGAKTKNLIFLLDSVGISNTHLLVYFLMSSLCAAATPKDNTDSILRINGMFSQTSRGIFEAQRERDERDVLCVFKGSR